MKLRAVAVTVACLALACDSTSPITPVALDYDEVPEQATVNVKFNARIAVVGRNGVVVTSASPVITLSVYRSPTELPLSATVTASNGIASFDMTLGLAGNYTLEATSPGLSPAIALVAVVNP